MTWWLLIIMTFDASSGRLDSKECVDGFRKSADCRKEGANIEYINNELRPELKTVIQCHPVKEERLKKFPGPCSTHAYER